MQVTGVMRMLESATWSASAPRFPGLYAGTVEGVRKDGRLEVSVPAVFDQTAPSAHALARPCFPYGHFFVPVVGDRVWIAFENGDPTAPVWLGVWYPDGKVPEKADTDPPVKRVIRTSAGQLVIIDDTEGAEQLVLADKTGSRIELRTDGVLIKCARDLTIDASGRQVQVKASRVDITEA
jgi:hypothetical protein